MNSSILPSLMSFVAVIVMIPVALWLFKRTRALRSGADGPLSIVAALGVGPRERIAVVRAGDRTLLLGITAQSVNLLCELDGWPDKADSPVAASRFFALLERHRADTRQPGNNANTPS